MAFHLLRNLFGTQDPSDPDVWTDVVHRPLVITPPSTWSTWDPARHPHYDMVVRERIRKGCALRMLQLDWECALDDAAALREQPRAAARV